ncbi:DUF1707 domain-containing protein [Actinoplanes sp. NPDC051411]|uniref:DUF1707 SHOCT-like domain-containing protein n=1 Tax=Actinoplanes sp. NPDC051411 TaxID=3155522 RepID=UPI00344A5BD4
MAEEMRRDQMRASDADRERVVERLRDALNEGRLDLGEYDERMQQAYAAKTYGDLDGLLTDLPVGQPPVPAAAAVEPKPKNPTAEWIFHQWQSWVPAAVVLTAIWAISGFGDYWPGWIIGIWAAALLWRTINGLMTGAPRREVEERAARELREREEKERRALENERRTQQAFPPKAKKTDMSGSSGGDTPDLG